MKAHELLKIYEEDSFIKTLLEEIKSKKNVYIKGLSGSLDAIIASVNYKVNPQHNIFILNDIEDAAYFYNDLQNLLGEENVYLFPMSYKKPYLYEEIDNAIVNFKDYICTEVLAEKLLLAEKLSNADSVEVNGIELKVLIEKTR